MQIIEKHSTHKNNSFIITLLVLYIYIQVATPFIRFPILSDISASLILAILIVISVFIKNYNIKLGILGGQIIILYLIMLLSYLFSPYKQFFDSNLWFHEYWKELFLYFFIIWIIKTQNDLRIFVYGIVFMIGTYQLHSWWDFLNGGSYVWQQGIPRMTGVWSGGGGGSANAWGLTGFFFMPLGVYVYKTCNKPMIKYGSMLFILLSSMSVIFSGTRGASICLMLIIIITFHKMIFNIKSLTLLIIAISLIYFYLPLDLKDRYFGNFITIDSVDQRFEEIAAESAEGREQGLIDGWLLFEKKPLLGWGPSSSSIARLEINSDLVQTLQKEHRYVQLHNLYGQTISEIGIIGTGQFVILLFLSWRLLRRSLNLSYKGNNSDIILMSKITRLIYIAYLIFGFDSHILYRMHWYILFGLSNILHTLANEGMPKKVRNF